MHKGRCFTIDISRLPVQPGIRAPNPQVLDEIAAVIDQGLNTGMVQRDQTGDVMVRDTLVGMNQAPAQRLDVNFSNREMTCQTR